MSRAVDGWVDILDQHKSGVFDAWPEDKPLPPLGASEQVFSATIDANCPPEDDRAAAEHAVAALVRHFGLLIGERPLADDHPRLMPDGRRRYRVRALVTRPDDWTPTGQTIPLPLESL